MIEDSAAAGIAGMADIGNPRVPMGTDAVAALVNASANYTSGAVMHPRYSQPANDPAFFPVARPAPVLNENGGARYGLQVQVPNLIDPSAGATQANGRVIRGRGTGGSFWESVAG